ncbi:peptide MFS transporter [Horticoccus sp. 23ND18S-11]|uniref:peptide MFS transporter n=1 Tax=Horticoccus sp. 23ND18S-11 TaxID=3391832 RepID=UPI0039C97755
MSSAPAPRSAAPDPIVPLDPLHTGGLGGHPRGLTTLFFTEMWERFSYYGMRALLVLFMTTAAAQGGLQFTDRQAAAVYGTYTMSVYLLCILGGFIADNFIGSRKAVLWGGITIACGHFTMAIHSSVTFFIGLGLVAIGTGLLKPNISTMVGSLYQPTDERRDAGFSIFYMGINIGALTASIVCGFLAQNAWFKNLIAGWGFDPTKSWHWAFAAAGFGMTFGLITYLRRAPTLAHVGHAPALNADGRPWGKLALVALCSLALIGIMYLSDQHRWIVIALFGLQVASVLFFAFRPNVESRRIAAILILFIAAQVFWAIFEQAGSSISLFADRLTDNRIFGWQFPSAWWQSINAAWVILLAPIFAWLWTRLGSKQPSSPLKFTLGLLFVGLSFLWMIPAARLTAEGKVSPIWLLGLFLLQTIGEMLLSPVGLSTMTKLAPARLLGVVMGIWFLAAALGNKLAGVLAGEFNSSSPASIASFFLHQALWVGGATVVLLALVPWVKKLMGGVR